MNSKASACFIWAAVLFVVGLFLGRFDTEVLDLFNRAIGPDNYGTTRWVLQIDSDIRWFLSTIPAVLIGAGIVINVLAPKPTRPTPPPEPGVDTTA